MLSVAHLAAWKASMRDGIVTSPFPHVPLPTEPLHATVSAQVNFLGNSICRYCETAVVQACVT